MLGGSQALSRSLFSQLIPKGKEGEYFGLYEISDKGTSWLGPLLFGLAYDITRSYRVAIFSLLVFFVVGMVLLFLVPMRRAIEAAGKRAPPALGYASSSSAPGRRRPARRGWTLARLALVLAVPAWTRFSGDAGVGAVQAVRVRHVDDVEPGRVEHRLEQPAERAVLGADVLGVVARRCTRRPGRPAAPANQPSNTSGASPGAKS